MRAEDIAPGDQLRFREWDDMEKEFGLDVDGHIDCRFCFSRYMRPLCGREVTVESVCGEHVYLEGNGAACENGNGSMRTWSISADMLEPIAEVPQPDGILDSLLRVLIP